MRWSNHRLVKLKLKLLNQMAPQSFNLLNENETAAADGWPGKSENVLCRLVVGCVDLNMQARLLGERNVWSGKNENVLCRLVVGSVNLNMQARLLGERNLHFRVV
jgi:hypothetical protein